MNATTSVPTRKPAAPVPSQTARAKEQASPTTITLVIKSAHQYFGANRVPLAQEAGFEWDDRHRLSLRSYDTNGVIASMEVHGFQEAVGELSSIDISIDPDHCPIECQAGTRLIGAMSKFAESMEGHVCDGLGKRLSADECEGLARHIDEIMARRAKAVRPTKVKQADGTFKVIRKVSFVTETFSARGKWLRDSYFDVEPASFYDGQIQGTRLAAEFLEYQKNHRLSRLDLSWIVRDAVAMPDGLSATKATRGNVAAGFLDVISEMVIFAAKHASLNGFITSRMAKHEHYKEWWARTAAEEAASFSGRMRAAREAKKAERQGGAA